MSKKLGAKGIMLTLTLSYIAPQTSTLLTSLLLIEIGTTFGTSIGVTNQMKSVNSLLGIASALVMGVLSVRIKHRNLLITGLSLCVISCIGCCMAPSFAMLVVVFALGGIATNMIFPMSTALIGQHIPREGRTNAISYLMAGNALLYLVGMPLVNYIGDWRRSFMFFSIPILLISVVMSWILIPREITLIQSIDIFEGYKGIFSNKSAIASLLGHAFGSGIWIITLSLAFSFFREVFSMSRGSVVYLTFGTAGAYLVGAILSRSIIPRLGRKKATMFSVVLMGLFSLIYLSGAGFLVSVLGCLLVCFVAGVNASASQGLNLEQVPQFRGSMMSMVTAFGSVGYAVSLALGGFVLINYGWSTIGVVVTIFSLIGLLVLNFFVEEPQ